VKEDIEMFENLRTSFVFVPIVSKQHVGLLKREKNPEVFDVITSLVSLVYRGFRCEKVTSHGYSYSKCSVTSLRDISIVGDHVMRY
jgi:hypothetical protein